MGSAAASLSVAIMGYDVTSLRLLCFLLLTLALFGVCGCLSGCELANLAFLDLFLLRAKTENFIRTFQFGSFSSRNYHVKMLCVNKERLD